MARGRKPIVIDNRAACHRCGSLVSVLSGSYIVCPDLKGHIPLMPDETPHNRIVDGIGQALKITGRSSENEPVYMPDPEDARFRLTESGGWYFVPEKCPRGGAA